MSYLSQDKLVILGAAGAIGSNMMQAALTMGLIRTGLLVRDYGILVEAGVLYGWAHRLRLGRVSLRDFHALQGDS